MTNYLGVSAVNGPRLLDGSVSHGDVSAPGLSQLIYVKLPFSGQAQLVSSYLPTYLSLYLPYSVTTDQTVHTRLLSTKALR